jgi:salicylate hydroxylase
MAGANLDIAIAGGGIGGLAVAIALSRLGISSQVFERRAEFPDEGAGIQIGPNGTRILQSLGVAELLQERAAIPDALSVRDGITGRELTRLPLGEWISKRHGAPYWTAHRKDLHKALRRRAESEPLITLNPGVEITSFVNDGESIKVIGNTGEVANASLLIGADGLWSNVRKQIAPAVWPQPVGKAAFRSVVSADRLPAELIPNAVHIWLAPGAHIVHYPVNGGRDIALVVIANDKALQPGWENVTSAEVPHNKVLDFASSVQSLIQRADEWRQWTLYSLPSLTRWSAGRAVLLGDAAHPMLPFLAQGAVMALEDAETLAECSASSRNDMKAALQKFAQQRRYRVRRVAEASERIYHMTGASALARNVTMRLMPPTHVMAGFNWLYGWRI